MSYKILQNYAKALLYAALEEKKEDQVMQELKVLRGVLEKEKDVFSFLSFSSEKEEKKVNLLEKALKNLSPLTKNFMLALLRKNRIKLFFEIEEMYEKLFQKKKGIFTGVVSSARDLKDSEKKSIAKKVEELFAKKVLLEFQKDERLISGERVCVENYLVDNTVQGHLNKLEETLKKG